MAKLLSGHCSSRRWALVGRLENESTDQVQGIAPVPLWVRPEPRRPAWDYRSPIIADGLQWILNCSSGERRASRPVPPLLWDIAPGQTG